MNIALINPPAKEIIEHGDMPGFPHIGLAYLGACLPDYVNPKIIDARFEEISLDEVLERLKNFRLIL